jgi:uncharacterized protein
MVELIKSKIKLKTNFTIEKEYKDCVNDLINHEMVRKMQNFVQHGDISCLDHSFYVSYISYRVCKKLGFDYCSAARGGLLHDFFLYDWHIDKPYKGLHGFVHPNIALQNADEHFFLNNIERDIIKKHMWPMTIRPPRYKESFVVLTVDKYCASMEIVKIKSKRNVNQYQEMSTTPKDEKI